MGDPRFLLFHILKVRCLERTGGRSDDEFVAACVCRQAYGECYGLGDGGWVHHALARHGGPELLPYFGICGSGEKRDNADGSGAKLLAECFGKSM